MVDSGRRPARRVATPKRDIVETTVTDDGLTVVSEHMPDVLSVSLGFWVGTGSVDEPGPIAGASHFLEHLLFKGTAQRSARQIAEAIDAEGGDMNAFTTKEHTAFYVRLLADSVDLGLDVLSEIIWGPALRTDELEAERQVILEEILMHGDEPAEEVHDLFNSALYPDHPLGRDVLGLESTVRTTSRDQVADFHRRHYRTANVIVTAAGKIEHDRIAEGVVRRLDKAAGEVGREMLLGGAPPERSAPSSRAKRRLIVNRPTEQAHVMVGMPAFQRNHPDRQVLNVLDHILGGGMSSRLFQSVREERGLAYNVYSYRSSYQGAGDLAVYAGTAPSRADEVVKLITEELDKMAAAGVTEEELVAAKSHIRGATALGLEDSGARMSRLGRSQLNQGRVPSLAELDAEIAAVTTDDISRVAEKILGGPRSLVVLGPFDDDAFPDWDGSPVPSAQRVTRVGVFGAGGRMGATVCAAVSADPGLALVAAVDPVHVGQKLEPGGLVVAADREAMADAGVQVAVDFTVASAAAANAGWCARNGVHTVIGTTGLSPEELAEVKSLFEAGDANCVVAPNFAIGAVLMMRFAEMAAPWFETAEIIELHHDGKLDAPSGTALLTAARIASARSRPPVEAESVPARGFEGAPGVRVHSVRLRGLVAHQEVLFGTAGQVLTLRHDSLDRASFMPGVLLAIKRVPARRGFTLGLDPLLGI